jgi:hypothetical protein
MPVRPGLHQHAEALLDVRGSKPFDPDFRASVIARLAVPVLPMDERGSARAYAMPGRKITPKKIYSGVLRIPGRVPLASLH